MNPYQTLLESPKFDPGKGCRDFVIRLDHDEERREYVLHAFFLDAEGGYGAGTYWPYRFASQSEQLGLALDSFNKVVANTLAIVESY